jgi:hypothetical protein
VSRPKSCHDVEATLRAFEGSQRYPIPAGVSLADYPSVVIWCERFSVLISPADLKPATGG